MRFILSLVSIFCTMNLFAQEITSIQEPLKKACSKITYEASASYLYWSAMEDNLEYAIENSIALGPISFQPVGLFKSPKGNWRSGFRVEGAVASEMAAFNQFGLRTYWNYYQMSSSDSCEVADASVLPLAATTVSSLLAAGGIPFVLCDRATGKWTLRLNEFALNLEYFWQAAPRVLFRPYMGLYGVIINQKLRSFYRNVPITVPVAASINITNHAKNNFWGVGPSIGLGMSWNFWKYCSVIGNSCIAGLYGKAFNDSVTDVPEGLGFLYSNFTDKVTRLRTMIGTLLGLEWGGPISDCAALSVSACYEWQFWPSQWRSVGSELPNFFAGSSGRGDLSFQGLVVSAKADF